MRPGGATGHGIRRNVCLLRPPPLKGEGRGGVRAARRVARQQGLSAMPRFSRMKHHTKAARRLRKQPTEAEQRLWSRLRGEQLGVAFRRQHPIKGYIVDFYAPAVKLAVEVDGGQHATAGLREEIRTRALTGQGISVLRFWNNEVLGNTEGVSRAIQTVLAHLASQTPTLSPPPYRGRGRQRRHPSARPELHPSGERALTLVPTFPQASPFPGRGGDRGGVCGAAAGRGNAERRPR